MSMRAGPSARDLQANVGEKRKEEGNGDGANGQKRLILWRDCKE